ncbi:MAG: hypothetical protein F4X81_12240 [Gammaproteobacteria bacterium]|nr:hypothetical protein [Gammaproteobacteria bacterium]MYE52224.1 hypothetical protein [Gammaproteobacteria bacterium]MYF49319.1 hypothetical protein [Gammaproteobacteria bacterium]
MKWLDKLGKDRRGSRPRCVLLTEGDPATVSVRLTDLIGRPDVVISPDDVWQPNGKASVREAQLDKALEGGRTLLDERTRQELRDWWLATNTSRARTPNWDIASTCTISGKRGMLLVEAKAHEGELSSDDRCGATGANRVRIERALAEATTDLRRATGETWQLSPNHHYQLSNRFAWSWKLASLGVPVVLLYLGFLNAREMPEPRLYSEPGWRTVLADHCRGVVDETCWESTLDVHGVQLLPMARVFEQPFGG